MRFYLVAMIFIVFDIEIIFLFPCAVVFRELGAFGLVAIVHLRRRGVRVVRVPDRQRRARLGPGQAAAAASTSSIAGRTSTVDDPPGRPRGPRAGRRDGPTPSEAA